MMRMLRWAARLRSHRASGAGLRHTTTGQHLAQTPRKVTTFAAHVEASTGSAACLEACADDRKRVARSNDGLPAETPVLDPASRRPSRARAGAS
jgi:hypothetical protein